MSSMGGRELDETPGTMGAWIFTEAPPVRSVPMGSFEVVKPHVESETKEEAADRAEREEQERRDFVKAQPRVTLAMHDLDKTFPRTSLREAFDTFERFGGRVLVADDGTLKFTVPEQFAEVGHRRIEQEVHAAVRVLSSAPQVVGRCVRERRELPDRHAGVGGSVA